MKKSYILLSILFAFVFILTSCGARSEKPYPSSDESHEQSSRESSTNQSSEDESTNIYIIIDDGQKKIVSYNYKFETTDVVDLINKISEEASNFNGGTESQKVTKESAKVVYRIPQDNADEFENYLDITLSNYLDDKVLEIEDATGEYTDIEATIETYEDRISYYEGLVQNPNTTAEERVIYNDKIDELNAKILSYNKQKEIINNATAYATFVVSVTEKETPKSASDKFKDALSYAGRRLIVVLPICILACGTYAAVVLINKKKKNNNDNSLDNKE